MHRKILVCVCRDRNMYVQVCMVRDEKKTLGTLLHYSPYC